MRENSMTHRLAIIIPAYKATFYELKFVKKTYL